MTRPQEAALEAVIGLEVHVQLRTERKLFCADRTRFGDAPNTNVCPVCLGLPGALPVPDREAVELAARAALALGCTVHAESVFARKSYFYPDLPKGYQISQFDRPLATGGRFALEGDDAGEGRGAGETGEGRGRGGGREAGEARRAGEAGETGETRGGDEARAVRGVRIRRIHLEEDAGKSLHDRFDGATAIDLNRAGTPLVELVTEPDLRTPAEARAWLQELRGLIAWLDVSDCNMEEGSLRVDANVSVRPEGSATLGTKTEIKNMNSFSGIERALEVEIARQRGVVAAGGRVAHETLLWDEARATVRPMRSKEESEDYRYFPEPDLPPLRIEPDRLKAIAAALPELPRDRRSRFVREHTLPAYDAGVLTANRALADYFEEAAEGAGDAKEASNWVMGPVLAAMNARGDAADAFPVRPTALVALIGLVSGGTVSRAVARDVLARMLETGRSPEEIVAEEGLAQVSDAGRIEGWIDDALAAHPDAVVRFRAGENRLRGFFIGEVMKRSGGKADPKEVGRLLAERLAG